VKRTEKAGNIVSQREDEKRATNAQHIKKPRSHLDYWKTRVFKPHLTRGDSVRVEVPNWAVEIQAHGVRKRLSLSTSNKLDAAAKARDIYLSVQANGWEATLGKYRPERYEPKLTNATLGEFLDRVKQRADLDPGTFTDYARALRKIASDVIGESANSRKFGYRGTGYSDWLTRVHAMKLADLTRAKVQTWKRDFLAQAGADQLSQRHAKVSVNSFLRRARSLFAPKVLRHLDITCESPFSGIEFEPRQSLRYRSQIDLEELVAAAREELSTAQPEAFKVFLLAAYAGLRRAEIDSLSWQAFRWDEHAIRIEPTRHYRLKTETSAGDVPIDAELVSVFRGLHAKAKSEFVVEVNDRPLGRRPRSRQSAGYRCEEIFDFLSHWLRAKGVADGKPIHALRKEYGSIVNQKYGIFVASRALRHASVAITGQYYVDARGARPTVGLGHLLTDMTENSLIIPIREKLPTRSKKRSRTR
jgi:integrase